MLMAADSPALRYNLYQPRADKGFPLQSGLVKKGPGYKMTRLNIIYLDILKIRFH